MNKTKERTYHLIMLLNFFVYLFFIFLISILSPTSLFYDVWNYLPTLVKISIRDHQFPGLATVLNYNETHSQLRTFQIAEFYVPGILNSMIILLTNLDIILIFQFFPLIPLVNYFLIHQITNVIQNEEDENQKGIYFLKIVLPWLYLVIPGRPLQSWLYINEIIGSSFFLFFVLNLVITFSNRRFSLKNELIIFITIFFLSFTYQWATIKYFFFAYFLLLGRYLEFSSKTILDPFKLKMITILETTFILIRIQAIISIPDFGIDTDVLVLIIITSSLAHLIISSLLYKVNTEYLKSYLSTINTKFKNSLSKVDPKNIRKKLSNFVPIFFLFVAGILFAFFTLIWVIEVIYLKNVESISKNRAITTPSWVSMTIYVSMGLMLIIVIWGIVLSWKNRNTKLDMQFLYFYISSFLAIVIFSSLLVLTLYQPYTFYLFSRIPEVFCLGMFIIILVKIIKTKHQQGLLLLIVFFLLITNIKLSLDRFPDNYNPKEDVGFQWIIENTNFDNPLFSDRKVVTALTYYGRPHLYSAGNNEVAKDIYYINDPKESINNIALSISSDRVPSANYSYFYWVISDISLNNYFRPALVQTESINSTLFKNLLINHYDELIYSQPSGLHVFLFKSPLTE